MPFSHLIANSPGIASLNLSAGSMSGKAPSPSSHSVFSLSALHRIADHQLSPKSRFNLRMRWAQSSPLRMSHGRPERSDCVSSTVKATRSLADGGASEAYRAGYLDAARAPLRPSADEIRASEARACLRRYVGHLCFLERSHLRQAAFAALGSIDHEL